MQAISKQKNRKTPIKISLSRPSLNDRNHAARFSRNTTQPPKRGKKRRKKGRSLSAGSRLSSGTHADLLARQHGLRPLSFRDEPNRPRRACGPETPHDASRDDFVAAAIAPAPRHHSSSLLLLGSLVGGVLSLTKLPPCLATDKIPAADDAAIAGKYQPRATTAVNEGHRHRAHS
ncbi:hypothetical protein MRX96_007880 [Rhipicephalus microplus]